MTYNDGSALKRAAFTSPSSEKLARPRLLRCEGVDAEALGLSLGLSLGLRRRSRCGGVDAEALGLSLGLSLGLRLSE